MPARHRPTGNNISVTGHGSMEDLMPTAEHSRIFAPVDCPDIAPSVSPLAPEPHGQWVLGSTCLLDFHQISEHLWGSPQPGTSQYSRPFFVSTQPHGPSNAELQGRQELLGHAQRVSHSGSQKQNTIAVRGIFRCFCWQPCDIPLPHVIFEACGTFLHLRFEMVQWTGSGMKKVPIIWDSPANLRAIELKVLEHLSCAEDDSRKKKHRHVYIFIYNYVASRHYCYVFGTKLGGVLPLRMRHKAMQLVLGRLAGRKMWQTGVKSWKVSTVSILVGFQKGR